MGKSAVERFMYSNQVGRNNIDVVGADGCGHKIKDVPIYEFNNGDVDNIPYEVVVRGYNQHGTKFCEYDAYVYAKDNFRVYKKVCCKFGSLLEYQEWVDIISIIYDDFRTGKPDRDMTNANIFDYI